MVTVIHHIHSYDILSIPSFEVSNNENFWKELFVFVICLTSVVHIQDYIYVISLYSLNKGLYD
uniref:Putative ovule protein n=1 Tax=Solanum chacoense TaxID=4108 RepID=A0A0V0GSJ8_SOLCH